MFCGRAVALSLTLLGVFATHTAWAAPIKNVTSVTDVVKWTFLSGSGSVLTDTTNDVTASTTGSVNHQLLISNAQNLSGSYSFLFKADAPTGKVFDLASITAVPDTSGGNGPAPTSSGFPNLQISEVSDFSTNFADSNALTTGDTATFDIATVYFKVTANVTSPLNAFSNFQLNIHSKDAPPPPAVPEPSTWALLSIAGVTLAVARRRR